MNSQNSKVLVAVLLSEYQKAPDIEYVVVQISERSKHWTETPRFICYSEIELPSEKSLHAKLILSIQDQIKAVDVTASHHKRTLNATLQSYLAIEGPTS